MLVLSRHVDEEIVIQCPDGTIVSLILVAMRGDKARIGFNAPTKVQIHRREIWDAIHNPDPEPARHVALPAA